MYNKHYEVEEEAYKLLRECVGVNLTPELINKIADIRKGLNTRYKNEYYVEFPPLVMPTNAFVVRVRVHTVH